MCFAHRQLQFRKKIIAFGAPEIASRYTDRNTDTLRLSLETDQHYISAQVILVQLYSVSDGCCDDERR